MGGSSPNGPQVWLGDPSLDGDLVYVIRASQIDDKELMDKVSVEQVCDFFIYAKEVHNIIANKRSATTGRMCSVIFANDISGVRKAPDKRFSKALTSSSDRSAASVGS